MYIRPYAVTPVHFRAQPKFEFSTTNCSAGFSSNSFIVYNCLLVLYLMLFTTTSIVIAQQNSTLSSTTPSSEAEEESINLPLFTPGPDAGRFGNDSPPPPSSAPAADDFVLRYDDIVVRTTTGLLRGSRQISQGRSLAQFLGVPYALPPVNELRFMPPQPFVLRPPPTLPLDCLGYRAACPSAVDGSTWFQPQRYAGQPQQQQFLFQNRDHSTIQPNYNPVQSEDCLHLNIFIPLSPDGPFSGGPPLPPLPPELLLEEKRKFLLPVLVILHGGWWHAGSAVWLGGAHLAVKGNFVVVTANYRLGALGFLFNGIELPHDNLGLRDQNLALRWIRENIESFGGDPFRITLSGFEAGATSAAAQILTSPAWLVSIPPPGPGPAPPPPPPPPRLFQRAILLSGIDYHGKIVHDPRQQQLSSVNSLLDYVGCRGGSVEALRCLQSIPVEDILRWQSLMSSRFVLGPVYNTPFLPFDSVIDGIVQQRVNSGLPPMEMIVGFNDVLPLTQSGLLPIGDILVQSGLARAPQFRRGFGEEEWRRNILPFLIQLLAGKAVPPVAEQALTFAYTFNALRPISGLPSTSNLRSPIPLPPPPPPFLNVYFDPKSRKIVNVPNGPPPLFIVPEQQQRTVPGDDAGIERDHALANLRMLEKFVNDAVVGVPTHRFIQSMLTVQSALETGLGPPFEGGARMPIFYYYWTYSRRANADNINARRDYQLDRFAFETTRPLGPSPLQPPPSQGSGQSEFLFGDDVLFFLFDPEHIQSESDAIVSKVWTDALTSFIWKGNPNPLDLTPDEFYQSDGNRQQWPPTDLRQPSYLFLANSLNFLSVNKGVQIEAFSGLPRDREFIFWDRVVQESYRLPTPSSPFPPPCCAELMRSREPRIVVAFDDAAAPCSAFHFKRSLSHLFLGTLLVLVSRLRVH